MYEVAMLHILHCRIPFVHWLVWRECACQRCFSFRLWISLLLWIRKGVAKRNFIIFIVINGWQLADVKRDCCSSACALTQICSQTMNFPPKKSNPENWISSPPNFQAIQNFQTEQKLVQLDILLFSKFSHLILSERRTMHDDMLAHCSAKFTRARVMR